MSPKHVHSIDESVIRVKAMVALMEHSGDRVAVIRFPGTAGMPPFHRLVGGSVEYGERAKTAAVREVREEIGIDLAHIEHLGVIENLFELDDEVGHEIVFIYRASIDAAVIPPGGGWFQDNGDPIWVEWLPLHEPLELALYPAGVAGVLGFSGP